MRRRSLTNSRRLKSRDAVSAYRERNDLCEWSVWLGLQVENGKLNPMWPGLMIDGVELNHIWSVGRRPDCRSNFIMLENAAHAWFHANLSSGRTLCVLTKLRKREKLGEPEEFDLAEINEAAGKSVLGMIEGYDLPAWCEPYRAEAVERLAKLAMEE